MFIHISEMTVSTLCHNHHQRLRYYSVFFFFHRPLPHSLTSFVRYNSSMITNLQVPHVSHRPFGAVSAAPPSAPPPAASFNASLRHRKRQHLISTSRLSLLTLPLSPTHDEGVKRRAIEAAPHWTYFSLFSYCPFSFFLLSYLEKIGWKNNWLKTKPREAESNLFLNIHDWKYSYYGGACSKSHTYPNSLSTPINLICYLSYHTAL